MVAERRYFSLAARPGPAVLEDTAPGHITACACPHRARPAGAIWKDRPHRFYETPVLLADDDRADQCAGRRLRGNANAQFPQGCSEPRAPGAECFAEGRRMRFMRDDFCCLRKTGRQLKPGDTHPGRGRTLTSLSPESCRPCSTRINSTLAKCEWEGRGLARHFVKVAERSHIAAQTLVSFIEATTGTNTAEAR